MTQTCTTCKAEKPLADYWKDSSRRSGHYPVCKPCSAAAKRASERRVKERDPAAFTARHKEYKRRYAARHPERMREADRRRRLAHKYGLTVKQYDDMVAAQQGQCGVCGIAPSRPLVVDHDHGSGERRDLLCSHCNLALGHLFDSPELADRAAAYLRRWGK